MDCIFIILFYFNSTVSGVTVLCDVTVKPDAATETLYISLCSCYFKVSLPIFGYASACNVCIIEELQKFALHEIQDNRNW